MFGVRAARLFDGTSGSTLRAPLVLIEDGRIAEVTEAAAVGAGGVTVVDLGDVTLLPGLVDCHQHLVFDASDDPVGHLAGRDDGEVLAQARLAARSALATGITTVRDLGDRGYVLLALREELAREPPAAWLWPATPAGWGSLSCHAADDRRWAGEGQVMTAGDRQQGSVCGLERFWGISGLVVGVVMLVGRGWLSHLVADLASVAPGDRVLDVGCGPGGAAREAARRGATVTGVDPAPMMLRLGRCLSRGRSGRGIVFLRGAAEALPVADRSVTVAWAVSSAHHWADVAAGLGELHRVLQPGGRLIIAERLARPGARGLAAHGFTQAQAAETVAAAQSAGFTDVGQETHRAGRHAITVVRAHRPTGKTG